MWILTPSALPILIILAACGGASRPDAGFSVRDSAGVRIAESTGTLWDEGTGWTVAAEPSLAIGTSEGEGPYQLFRVAGATRLPDGRIVVANAGTGEIRFFSDQGEFLTSSGGEGEGPGFFRLLYSIQRYRGDSLVAADGRLNRISVFDGEGRFARSFNLGTSAGLFAQPLGPLTDGSIMIMAPRYQTPEGEALDSAYCIRFSPDGTEIDTLAFLPDQMRYGFSDGDAFLSGSVPFTPFAVGAVTGDRIALGSSSSYSIGVYTPDGGLESVIRRAFENRRVLPPDVERFKESILQSRRRDPARQRMMQQVWERVEFPDVMPAFDDFLVDSQGNLWVADYQPQGESVSSWTVFDADGRMLGSMTLPSRLRVYEIGADYVLGVKFDDYDVPQIRLYPLLKGD